MGQIRQQHPSLVVYLGQLFKLFVDVFEHIVESTTQPVYFVVAVTVPAVQVSRCTR